MKPIVIAGGGIGGLALAGALQRRGRPVLVVEARERIAAVGAGISLWPNALAALDDIGLGDQVRAAGGTADAGGVRIPDGRWLRRMDAATLRDALGEPLLVIHRAALLEVLANAVDPDAVRLGTAVQSVDPGPSEVTVHLADGSTLDAAAVIGADGVASAVARTLDPHLPRSYTGYTAWRGVAECGLGGHEPAETWGADGEFGYVPLGAARTYWFATQVTAEGERAPHGELAYLSERFARWHDPIADLLGHTEPAEVLRHDLYDRRPLRRWAGGRVAVIGDAAHPMRPHLGQGGCQALVDAATLARTIDGSDDLPAAFTRFESLRRREVRRVVRTSALVGRALHAPSRMRPVVHRLAALTPQSALVWSMARVAGRAAYRPV